MTARGIRNNNPLNIRRTKSRWIGMKAEVTDQAFCEFTSLAYGFRAAFVLLRQYYVKYQLVTIDQIIHRWAPPSENYTAVYVKNVCKITGLSPDELLPHPDLQERIRSRIAERRAARLMDEEEQAATESAESEAPDEEDSEEDAEIEELIERLEQLAGEDEL